uniref:Uncharacterized protein n=1 Tax=Arundo donax TaxID=35708 RepID=A0A0A8YUK0_ARUDO
MAWLSRCNGGVPSSGGCEGSTGTPHGSEIDCKHRRSPTSSMSLDISCLSCTCPTSSSSPLSSICAGATAGVLTTTAADPSSNRPSRWHRRPHREPRSRRLPSCLSEISTSNSWTKTSSIEEFLVCACRRRRSKLLWTRQIWWTWCTPRGSRSAGARKGARWSRRR